VNSTRGLDSWIEIDAIGGIGVIHCNGGKNEEIHHEEDSQLPLRYSLLMSSWATHRMAANQRSVGVLSNC
jgi:hypothetical protein